MTRVQAWADGRGGLVWRDRRPAVLAAHLSSLGFELQAPDGSRGQILRIGDQSILLDAQPAGGVVDEGLAFASGEAGVSASAGGAGRPVAHRNGVKRLAAVGVATVDAERVVRQNPWLAFEPAGEDRALGASAWSGTAGSTVLLLLEPSTEGRLASALARRGEGPVALYLARPAAGQDDVSLQPESRFEARPRVALGARRRWPLGSAARLIPPTHSWGPFLLLVEQPAAATSVPGERARPAAGGHPSVGGGSGRPGPLDSRS